MKLKNLIDLIQGKIYTILILLLLGCSQNSFSQLSTKHFIPPLTAAAQGNANPEQQYLYLSTPSRTDVNYVITPVGQPQSAQIIGTIRNDDSREVFLGNGYGQLFIASGATGRIYANKGYIIESERPIYASVRVIAGNADQAGAIVSKGLSALGNTFRVGCFTNENPQTNYLNFVSVMASEDNTDVTFSNLPSGLIVENYNGPTPFSINLNEGESFTLATNSARSTINRDGIIGSLIESTKPIAVNIGSANGSFHNGSSRDYGIDQIVDFSKTGSEYIFVRGDGSDGWENILLVAHENNTSIRINGSAPVATINAGDYYVIEGNAYSPRDNMYIQTSNNVFAYQGVGGAEGREANQGLFFVPPLSCEAIGNLDNIASITRIGDITYNGGVSIVSKTGATVTINGRALSNFSVTGPNTVQGNPDYVTYKASNLTGNVSIQSTDELYCAYFNINGAATSGGFYSGFPTAPEVSFQTQFTALGNCLPNVTLNAENTETFDSFEWFYDDGSGFAATGNTSDSLVPTAPGRYKIVGTISCTGLVLESAEVPINICPSDMDEDGIIDNLDIDKDNDGILDCVESNGDAMINLVNVNSPEVVFQDGTTSNVIMSSTLNGSNSSGATNSFSGLSNGNFSSSIPAANNGQSIYRLDFTESVNIQLRENMDSPSTANSFETYVVRIFPSNKNITLVDPDGRLLVDTDFDGAYERGVEQFSGSEIRFQVNPNPIGTSPYTFLADQVDSFEFEHVVINGTDSSTFNANLSLTCFKRDSDMDGINDNLDRDSDNDGIPDIIENLGMEQSLSNTDNDSNGLDDVFNINSSPLDTDTDLIPDYLDLDSDNDGIYDIEESGSSLPDMNRDGIIDNINAIIGSNGWADPAESSPDSNEIGFEIRDFDSDSLYDYIDSDSDADNCNDVIEAGFADADDDGFLGGSPLTVDVQGIVTSTGDGYTDPNPKYLESAPVNVEQQPLDTTVCEGDIAVIIFDSTAYAVQWETSADGVNWNTINNGGIYSGAQTEELEINNTLSSLDNNLFRARLNRLGNSCTFFTDEILLTVNTPPNPSPVVELIQCDDDTDGISTFNLEEVNSEITANPDDFSFNYYTSQTAAELNDFSQTEFINDPSSYVNSTSPFSEGLWVNVEDSNGCSQVTRLNLLVATSQLPDGAVDQVINECDDLLDINGNDNSDNDDSDGITSFDFEYVRTLIANIFLPQTPEISFYRNESDALREQDPIEDISNYRNIGYPGRQDIYVRVDSEVSNDCQALGSFITLIVDPVPSFILENGQRVCSGSNLKTIELEPILEDPTAMYYYSWSFNGQEVSTDPVLEVSNAGTYSLTVTTTVANICSKTRSVTVTASELPELTTADLVIADDANGKMISLVDTAGLQMGDFSFSITDRNGNLERLPQDSPVFNNVRSGLFFYVITDLNGCGDIALPLSIVGFPKFFTPNNDGFNDTWRVEGLAPETLGQNLIFIYDRYGKLLQQISPSGDGWDGTINGNPLPSSDYWFEVKLVDGTELRGHFSLKR